MVQYPVALETLVLVDQEILAPEVLQLNKMQLQEKHLILLWLKEHRQ